jgi:hypothetical protein
MVYKWCLNNPPHTRKSDFFGGGLFADEMDALLCDVIVVHMDADICYVIGDKSRLDPISPPLSAAEKGKYITETIFHWLWPSGTAEDDRHLVAPAVESTETWLVAALSDDADPETNPAVLRRLVEIDFAMKGRECPKEAKKISKSASKYKAISRLAAENVDSVIEKCPHFRSLADAISAFIGDVEPAGA